MAEFVLYYKGRKLPPRSDLNRLRSVPGVRILERTPAHLLLVDAEAASLKRVLADLPGWVMAPEKEIPPP
jgi:hypothetical protein